MKMKKITALSMAVMMAASMIPSVPVISRRAKEACIILNFKPEQADQWAELGEKYTEETGVPVTVVTAASGCVPL